MAGLLFEYPGQFGSALLIVITSLGDWGYPLKGSAMSNPNRCFHVEDFEAFFAGEFSKGL